MDEKKAKILVVDDDLEFLQEVKRVLESHITMRLLLRPCRKRRRWYATKDLTWLF